MARLLSALLLWVVLFGICLGLGYPAVSRYDPRSQGNADAVQYYRVVSGSPADALPPWRYRLLTPLLAKPVAALARGHVGTFDPLGVGMLIINSAFTATAALATIVLARHAIPDARDETALVAGLVYLLNFDIAQEYLAGLVDASEGLLLVVLGLMLRSGRWWTLPVLAIVGTLAKETFVPLGAAFAVGWWLAVAVERHTRPPMAPAAWTLAMLAVGFAMVSLLRVAIVGGGESAIDVAGYAAARVGPLTGFAGVIGDRSFWYIFAWLLPLGLIGLTGIRSNPWVVASGAALLLALLLGVYSNAHGGAARAMFDAAGPVLSLGTTIVLARAARRLLVLGA